MVVDIERSYWVDAPIEEVWAILAAPESRAEAISVVDRYEQKGDVMIWHLSLPIPLVRRTVAVRTWDIERDPPTFVRFVGESRVMEVTGEHDLTEEDGGTRVRNRFVVDGKVPGVETFFRRRIDDELDRIMQHVRDEAGSVEPA